MIEVHNDAYTLSGFRAWVASLDEHGPRVSFARGIVHVETSAQSQETHEPVAAAINVVLSSLDIGRYFVPPSWFTHEASALSTEPDGFFALWSTLEQGDLRLNPEREIEMLGLRARRGPRVLDRRRADCRHQPANPDAWRRGVLR